MTAWKSAVTLLVMWRFYQPMREIVARAKQIAREQGSAVVSEAHLFVAVLDLTDDPETTVSALLGASGVSRQAARFYAQSALENRPAKGSETPRLTRGATLTLGAAFHEADHDGNLTLEARHLFIACARQRQTNVLLAPIGRSHALHLGDVLLPLGLDATRLREHLRGLKRSRRPYPNGHPLNELSSGAKEVIEAAQGAARASFCGLIAPPHLLLGLLSDPKSAEIFRNAGCDLEELGRRIRDSLTTDGETATMQKRFSPAARRVLERAARETRRAKGSFRGAKRSFIGCEELRLALLPPARHQNGPMSRKVGGLNGWWTPAQLQFLRATPAEVISEAPEEVESLGREEFSTPTAVRLRLFLSSALIALATLNGYFVLSWLSTGSLSKKQGLVVMARLALPFLMSILAALVLEGPLSYGLWCALRCFGTMALGAGAGRWLVVVALFLNFREF